MVRAQARRIVSDAKPESNRLSNKPRITEKHVQDATVQFLELDGWRAIRTDPVSDRTRGKGFGEVGMPDYLFLRYSEAARSILLIQMTALGRIEVLTDTQALFIEFKSPGGKLEEHQIRWHDTEAKRGALVLTVNNFDNFRAWYMQSGLVRRIAR